MTNAGFSEIQDGQHEPHQMSLPGVDAVFYPKSIVLVRRVVEPGAQGGVIPHHDVSPR